VCFTCHFKGEIHDWSADPIGGCTSCHKAPAGTIKTAEGVAFDHKPFLDGKVSCWKCRFDSVQGTGDVPKQVCVDCRHEPEKLEKLSDPKALHDWHVTKRKVECFRCHSEIRHGLHAEPYKFKNPCAACHTDGHTSPAKLFAGQGGAHCKRRRKAKTPSSK